MNEEMLKRALQNLEDLTGRKLRAAVTFTKKEKTGERETVLLKSAGMVTEITAETFSGLSRGLYSLYRLENSGVSVPEEGILLTAKFKDSGVMLDCSRNAVTTLSTAKRLIRVMAALGLNFLMLYTEDTYEIPDLPDFGYMRGRFTTAELQELDAYAAEYGVELVPCIQTLAHLRAYLRRAPESIKDTDDILLADNEETYEFIEKAIAACRKAFRTKKIHLGMDEAHMLGRGNHLDRFGYENGRDILVRHLKRVTEISKKYGFEPMIWSDMFYRVGSKTHLYYDTDVHFSDERPAEIPEELSLVYWDYYHEDPAFYNTMLKTHRELGKPIVFAGGLACWYGHLPRFEAAYNSSIAGLKAAAENQIDTVFATLWGDDGNECALDFILPYLSVYGSFMWADGDPRDIRFSMKFLFGISFDTLVQMGLYDFYLDPKTPGAPAPSGTRPVYYRGKRLFYTDPFYESGINRVLLPKAVDLYEQCIADLSGRREIVAEEAETHPNGENNLATLDFALAVYRYLTDKGNLILNLRDAYDASKTDREGKDYLRYLASQFIPALINDLEVLSQKQREFWMKNYKPFGYEVLSLRYGGMKERLRDVQTTLLDYTEGRIPEIAELEEPLSNSMQERFNTFNTLSKVGMTF